MRLIDRLAGKREQRGAYGPYRWPDAAGLSYPALNTTMPGGKTEDIPNDFGGYLHALQSSPPAFAAQMKRARYLSQARFTWRDLVTGKTFGDMNLALLERPWPSGTTGELLTKMEWHEGLAGNSFVLRRDTRSGPQLKVLRPDWVTIVVGSQIDSDDPSIQVDAEVVGYLYTPGGLGHGNKPVVLLPREVAHWSPLPDPAATFRGMSWITPLVREIQGDIATADHKLRYFENGATPNLVVKGIPAANSDEFRRVVGLMEDEHAGVANAYKTLYLAAGADATVVGSDLKQVAFKDVQGAGETRIAAVGEVPASLLGISEGMQGSSLNAGNYGEAKRSFIDGWLTSTLQSASACLGRLVTGKPDTELWFHTRDMPLVRDDAKASAEVEHAKAGTIRQLVDGGFEPQSVIDAVSTQDITKLVHTGKLSVQLQEPGTDPAAKA